MLNHGNGWDKLRLFALALITVAMPFSISICHFGVILFLILWMAEGEWTEKFKKIKGNGYLITIALLFLVNVIALSYTSHLNDGWMSVERKIFLLLLPLAIGSSGYAITKYQVSRLFGLFVITCLVAAAICIGAAFLSMHPEVKNDYLITSSFSQLNPHANNKWFFLSYVSLADTIKIHPTYFSLYLAFCLIIIYTNISLRMSVLRKILCWIAILFLGVFLALLSSRVVIFSLVTAAFAYVGFLIVQNKNTSEALRVCLIAGVLLLTVYLNPISWYRNVQELKVTPLSVQRDRLYANSIDIRLSLWWVGLKSIKTNNFLIGEGTGDTHYVMKQTADKFSIANILNTYDPHSQFIYTQLTHGIIGLVILTCIFIYSIYQAWKHQDFLYLTFLFFFLSVCVTESALEVQKGIIFFSFFNTIFLMNLNAFGVSTPFKFISHANS